jgi:hypothetical protein
MRSPLLSFGLLFRVWPEATATLDKRARQASLGFCPLQRTELRKSTHPGFPSPGSFPSRRFSRPQGFSPSETVRACSIPLPLLGFHLQDPPDRRRPCGHALLQARPTGSGRDPKDAGCDRRRTAVESPEGPPTFARYGRAAKKSNLQPRNPLADRQAHRRDKALMAVRTPSGPCSLRPCPASRACPSDPSRRKPEGKLRGSRSDADKENELPKELALLRLRASIKPLPPERWHTAEASD